MSASGNPTASGSTSGEKKTLPLDLSGNDLPPSPAPSSPHPGRRYNIATELVFTEGNDQYNASSVPIYQVCLHSIAVNGTNGTNSTILILLVHRVLLSSSPPAAAVVNMTTHAPVTPPAHTSSAIWPRSCPRSAPLWSPPAWRLWT